MFSDKELLNLNYQGYFPGPLETEAQFLKRISLTKKLIETPEESLKDQTQTFSIQDRVKKPSLSWVNTSLMHLYGFYADSLPAYFSNQNLSFFEGAATFLVNIQGHEIPLLQLRKELKKNSFFSFYTLEEILSHEMVHFLRSSFQEMQFEEHFAYLTSKHILRRYFGPLVRSSKEVFIFLGLLSSSLVLEISYLLFPSLLLKSFFLLGCSATLAFVTAGLWRLIKARKIFVSCLKKLKKLLGKNGMPCMVRLTDSEIRLIAKNKKLSLEEYALEKKDQSLRWRVLHLAYFLKV